MDGLGRDLRVYGGFGETKKGEHFEHGMCICIYIYIDIYIIYIIIYIPIYRHIPIYINGCFPRRYSKTKKTDATFERRWQSMFSSKIFFAI